MAATRYQVLYRWYNENLHQPILNNGEYEHFVEMFTKDHKINVTAEQLKERFYANPTDDEADQMRLDAENEKLAMIAFENSVDNVKYEMLYVYAGTKKIYHQLFRPECTGWLINRDNIDKLPESHIAKEVNEWEYDFLKVEDLSHPTGYQYVMMPDFVEKYKKFWFKDYTDELKKFKTYTNAEWENEHEKLVEWTPFTCKDKWEECVPTEDVEVCVYYTDPDSGAKYKNYFNSSTQGGVGKQKAVFVTDNYTSKEIEDIIRASCGGKVGREFTYTTPDGKQQETYGIDTGTIDSLLSNGVKIYVKAETLMVNDNNTTPKEDESAQSSFVTFFPIPEHYTTTPEGPYAIKDIYEKINGDPWFVFSTNGSLNDGLDTARRLAQKIGIENVKLIKLVPLTHKTRIK